MIEIKCTEAEKERIIFGLFVGFNEQGVCAVADNLNSWDCPLQNEEGCTSCLEHSIKWNISEGEE